MTSIDGFETVSIISPGGTLAAVFVPSANMVCPSLTHDGVELLAPGRGVSAYAERGKTMGIPLLYPWANRLARAGYEAAGKAVELPPPEGRYALDPNGLPIHGALPGLLRWEPAPRASEDRVSARLDWTAPKLLELFPFVHQLELEARAGDRELELITRVRATGDDPVPVSFGFHPYLQVPGVPRVEWEVSLGATERLEVDDHMIPTGARLPLEPQQFTLDDMSWDDGLAGLTTPPQFTVAAETHKLTVRFGEGFGFAQVFAPSPQDLICFEPMTAPTNALGDGGDLPVVEPGGEYRAAFTIAVSDN